jgi:integrase
MTFEQAIVTHIEKLKAHLASIPKHKHLAKKRTEEKIMYAAECAEAIRLLIPALPDYPVYLSSETVRKMETETPYNRYTAGYYNYHRRLIILLGFLKKQKIVECQIPEHFKKPERKLISTGTSKNTEHYIQFDQLMHMLKFDFPDQDCGIDDLRCAFVFTIMSESFCFFPSLPRLLAGMTKKDFDIKRREFYLSATVEADKRDIRKIRICLSSRGLLLLNAILFRTDNNRPFARLNTDSINNWLKENGFNLTYSVVRNLLINRASRSLPPVILAVMSNKLSYTSLTSECRERIFKGISDQRNKARNKQIKKIQFSTMRCHHHTYNEQHIDFVKTLSSEMHAAYRRSKKKTTQLQARLSAFFNKNSNIITSNETLSLLTEWLQYLVYSPSKDNSLGTIVTYFGPFAKVFIYETAKKPLSEMPAADIVELIEKISTQDQLVNKKNNMGRRLKSFFRYYINMYSHKDPDNEISDYLGSSAMSGESSEVRNVIITPYEFDMFIDHIRKTSPVDARQIATCAILAFWAGMRRDEIESFKINKLQMGQETTYRVSTSKTSSGRRAIQMWALMPEYYRNIILEQANACKNNGHLLWQNDEERTYLNSDIFPCAISELKDFFMDDELTLHSLRHSFASHMLIEMFGARLPELQSCLPRHYKSKHADDEYKYKFKQLFQQESHTYGSDSLWRISEQLGHLSPEISVQTYIHTIDWVLEAYIKQHEQHDSVINYQQFLKLFPNYDHGVFRQKILKEGLTEKGKIRLGNVCEWSQNKVTKLTSQ